MTTSAARLIDQLPRYVRNKVLSSGEFQIPVDLEQHLARLFPAYAALHRSENNSPSLG